MEMKNVWDDCVESETFVTHHAPFLRLFLTMAHIIRTRHTESFVLCRGPVGAIITTLPFPFFISSHVLIGRVVHGNALIGTLDLVPNSDTPFRGREGFP
jgi:hypothetical protein